MVRLHVGGLAADTTPEQLEQRFKSFGRVTNCEVVPPKEYDTMVPQSCSCRGFGYVDLDLTDDATLRRCIGAYNGSKWKGKVLRVQLAKQDYVTKLKSERAAAEEDTADQQADTHSQEEAPAVLNTAPLTLTAPDGKPVVAKPNKLKTNFTDSSQLPVSELSWARLPPTAAMQRKRAFEKQMAPGYKAHAAQRVAERAAKIQRADREASPELGAVDFLDERDKPKSQGVDLSRFGDEADDDLDVPELEGQRGGTTAAALAGVSGPVDVEADALWEQQGGLDTYLAALQAGSGSDAGSDGVLQSSSGIGSESPGESSIDREEPKHGDEMDELGTAHAPAVPPSGGEAEGRSVSSDATSNSEPDEEEAAADEAEGCGNVMDAVDGPPHASPEAQEPESPAASNARGTVLESDGKQADEDEQHDLREAVRELAAGAEFWAGGRGGSQLESNWLSSRDRLATALKQARRDAFKRSLPTR